MTDVQDRDYFDAIYFREPRGILFEIATLSPGFAVDEDPERLGEELRVPQMHAHLRERLEATLTPVANPRTARREKVGACWPATSSTASGPPTATRPACSSCTTAAAPTSTTCSRSATCSTPGGACTSSRRAHR